MKNYERVEDMCEWLMNAFNRIWLSDALDFFWRKVFFYGLLSFDDMILVIYTMQI